MARGLTSLDYDKGRHNSLSVKQQISWPSTVSEYNLLHEALGL